MDASCKLPEGRLNDNASFHTGLAISFRFVFFFLTRFPFTNKYTLTHTSEIVKLQFKIKK